MLLFLLHQIQRVVFRRNPSRNSHHSLSPRNIAFLPSISTKLQVFQTSDLNCPILLLFFSLSGLSLRLELRVIQTF